MIFRLFKNIKKPKQGSDNVSTPLAVELNDVKDTVADVKTVVFSESITKTRTTADATAMASVEPFEIKSATDVSGHSQPLMPKPKTTLEHQEPTIYIAEPKDEEVDPIILQLQKQAEAAKQRNRRLQRPVLSIGLTSVLVMLALFLSKLTGQVRQILVGIQFGYQSGFADAFTQGFLIPDYVYTLLIGGSIQSTIIPYLSSSLERGEGRRGWRAISTFITFMTILLTTVVIICEIFAPEIMQPFTTVNSYPIAVRATRALLPQAIFMMMAALIIGILNTYKRFVVTALTPCLYNLFLLISVAVFGGKSANAVVYTGLSITVGAGIYFLVQMAIAANELKNFSPNLKLRDPEVKTLFKLAIPTLISSSLPYLSTFIISSYYKLFDDGISYAYSNAVSTWQLPFGIVVIAITNVMLPHISESFARDDYEKAGKLFAQSFKSAMTIMIPAAICFCVLSKDVVRAIFKWSEAMPETSIANTAAILRFFCIMMVSHTIVYFMNNIFYAKRKTTIPMLTSVLNLALIYVFCHYLINVFNLGQESMAFAVSLASIGSVVFLFIMAKIFMPAFKINGLKQFLKMTSIAIIVVTAMLLTYEYFFSSYIPTRKLDQLIYLGVKALVVYVVYVLILLVGKIEELDIIKNKIKRVKPQINSNQPE